MKVWGSSLLFCLCRLCQGNKCSTVRRLGSVSAGVMIRLLHGPSQSRYHFFPKHPTALASQTAGPSCTTGCPLPVQSAKVTNNQPVMMHICVCVCGQEGIEQHASSEFLYKMVMYPPLLHTHTLLHMNKQLYAHRPIHIQNNVVAICRVLC